MNIIGIGLDATDLPRIAETLKRYGDRFLHRIFTEREIAYYARRRDPSRISPAGLQPRKRR